MIPKVVTGGRTQGVLRYLVGKGRHNEHEAARLVAGSPEVVMMGQGRVLDSSDVRELAEVLDEPKEQFGGGPRASVRDEAGRVTGWKDAHVWHCSLSLHPTEPALPGRREEIPVGGGERCWEALCEQFVSRMGLAGEQAAGNCRWVAVRHGRSRGGSDHAHIVVQLVGEDGKVPSTHYSGRRAQQVARQLEQEFGLRPLNATPHQGPSRWAVPGELECDERRGRRVNAHPALGSKEQRRPEHGDRQTLERAVRAAASASADEGEFVTALRRQGVQVIPRYAQGGTSRVVGYSVKRPGGVPYGGGRLARDLTIGALRNYWRQTPETTRRCAASWGASGGSEATAELTSATRRREAGVAQPGSSRPAGAPSWATATADLYRLEEQLAQARDDPMRVSQVAREAAGIVSAWAMSYGSDPRAHALARVGRDLGCAAQLPRSAGRRPKLGPRVTRPTALATMLLLSCPSASNELALMIAVQRLTEGIIRARRLSNDTAQLRAQDARIRQELQLFAHTPRQTPASASEPRREQTPGATPSQSSPRHDQHRRR